MSNRAVPRPWNAIQKAASTCTLCPLSEGRTHVAFGDGDPRASLVIIGDAPGRHEDLQGRPFVGAIGNLLDNLLLENSMTRDDVYLTTVVKCRTPRERDPLPEEVEACAPYLSEQLGHIRPQVIVTLGEAATHLVLGRQLPIERIAGYRFAVNGATVVPTFDPAEALKGSPSAMAALRRDIRTAKGILEGRVAAAGAGFLELRARHANEAVAAE